MPPADCGGQYLPGGRGEPGTLRENIGFGRPGATEEEIFEAAKRANIHDFIMSLPDQYDTYAGERGARLSGGQQRRTALLRALLCQPVQTLLLDEPFTGMDPELVSHAAAAVVRLAARRDTVLVTHDEHAADLLGWPVVRLETVAK